LIQVKGNQHMHAAKDWKTQFLPVKDDTLVNPLSSVAVTAPKMFFPETSPCRHVECLSDGSSSATPELIFTPTYISQGGLGGGSSLVADPGHWASVCPEIRSLEGMWTRGPEKFCTIKDGVVNINGVNLPIDYDDGVVRIPHWRTTWASGDKLMWVSEDSPDEVRVWHRVQSYPLN